MPTRLAPAQPTACTLEQSRELFYKDVQNRNGVTRTEAEQVLAVLDQLIAWNPSQLVHMPPNPKVDRKQNVVKYGIATAGTVFWASYPGPVYGAKLVLLPQATEDMESIRDSLRMTLNEIDHGAWRKLHADDLTPTIEFRYLRFPRDFDRAIKAMAEALAALE